MKIHRYIYTRLTKDLSPTGKNGFQSAFLPTDLLSNKEVLEIESHIHFPEGLQIQDQSVLFYKQIKGQYYMVLLLLNPLPEVKDDHGRGGAFLCQGFLVPEADWRPMWAIGDFKALIDRHVFASLDEVLNSPDVDRQAGRIRDLEIEVAADHWSRQLMQIEEEPEEQMLMAMYHLLKTQNRDVAIVVEGIPEAVSQRLDLCAIYMPDALRPRLGWDDAFDGGKIFFSPLRIFGYSEQMPTSGRPILFHTYGTPAVWPDPELSYLGRPSDPFSHWLQEVSVKPVARNLLNDMFALSEAMISGRPSTVDMATDPLFEAVNKDAVKDVFKRGLEVFLGPMWVEKLAEFMTTTQQMQMWMRGYPMHELTHLVEIGILDQGIAPENMPEPPTDKIVQQGSAALQALATMWSQAALTEEQLAAIPEDRIPEVLTAIMVRGEHEKLPYLSVLAYFKTYLHRLARNPAFLANLRIYMAAKVPENYSVFREGMAKMAIQMGEYGPLRDEPIDWIRTIDRWLAVSGGNPEAWKAARQIGKQMPLDAYPNLRAFATGKPEFTRELEEHGSGREGFLRCLVEVYGVGEDKLIQMGFFSTEIHEASKHRSWFGKLKNRFGL